MSWSQPSFCSTATLLLWPEMTMMILDRRDEADSMVLLIETMDCAQRPKTVV
jgi:hypothetical protein